MGFRMVIKGKSRAGAASLARHLQNTETNETAELWEVRGVAATDLDGALLEMEAVGSGARSQKPFYHAAINWRAHEQLNDDQKRHAIDALEHELGLDGQPRAVMQHVKDGREHLHVVWSRIDLDRMAAISDSHNYRKHEDVARQLERDFGHERTQGAHVEREGVARPDRTPSHAEMMQQDRTGISPKEMKAELTGLWNGTTTGQEFNQGLDERGYLLAKGDRRDFVVLDQAGEAHSLARRIEGARAADIRERMADIDREALPSVEAGRAIQFDRAADRVMEPEALHAATPEAEAGFSPVQEDAGREPWIEGAAGGPTGGAEMGEAEPITDSLMVAGDGPAKGAEKLSDFVVGLVDSFANQPAPKKYSALELATDPAARRAQYQREGAERRSDEALTHIREHMEAGRALRPEDVRSLTPEHLMNIHAKGDAYLQQMVQMRQKELDGSRERDGGD
jgi:hypothetical protein